MDTNAAMAMASPALAASVQVLTSSELFPRIAARMSGVPGVVLGFKAQCERESGDTLDQVGLVHCAAQRGNERVLLALQLLTRGVRYKSRMDAPFDAVMGYALASCARQTLDMAFLEWLDVVITDSNERDIGWPQLVTIIKRGDLALIEWMHDHDIAFFSDVMDVAASVGRLDIVRFLHTHRTEGCTKMAMSDAVAKGRLEVVQFLHEHRTEGCTSRSVNTAAQHGHLACIQYLHEHNVSGFTQWTMHEAAVAGQLAVVQFLHAHRTDGCRAMTLIEAARQRRDDVVAFLCEHRPMDEALRKQLIETAQQEELTHLMQCLARIEALPVETQRYAYGTEPVRRW